MKNPWLDLPNEAPFIASCDKKALSHPKYKLDGLRFDAFPTPYIGDINQARVVFLVLNPGFDERDVAFNPTNTSWLVESRKNLRHESMPPFYYLNPELSKTGGYKWWTSHLRPLNNAGVSWERLSHMCMCIELFPYPSVTYKHNKQYLPSQSYSFYLVREAIRLGKTIVIMRAKAKWLEAVPELTDYPYLELNNPQRVYISRINLDKKNGEGTFARLVENLNI